MQIAINIVPQPPDQRFGERKKENVTINAHKTPQEDRIKTGLVVGVYAIDVW